MLPSTSAALGAVSPTMLARLACPARVAFGQSGKRGARSSSAPALIGSIVHRAMELAVTGSPVDLAWDQAVAESAARGEHPDQLRALRKARLRYQLRAGEALSFVEGIDPADVHTEERLVSSDGLLEGTPDLVVVGVDGCTVVDFKTGLVLDVEEEMPKASYAQQIQIYAHLAGVTYGAAPAQGVLMSFRQGMVVVDVTPAAIETAVADALSNRAAFNERVPGQQPTKAGEVTCTWCDHQAWCDGYWQAAAEGRSLGFGHSIRGTIASDPEVSNNGLAAIAIDADVGLEAGTRALVAEIPRGVSDHWTRGDVVSFTRLSQPSPELAVFRFGARSLVHSWNDGD